MTDLDARCPYDDPQLRKAYRRGLKAAQAGKSIDECDHKHVGRATLLAFIEGYVAVRGPL
jgi:ribosome modulation factor